MWIAQENVPRLLRLADEIIEEDGEACWLEQFAFLLEQYKATPKWLVRRWMRSEAPA